jgi:hypothetical protein
LGEWLLGERDAFVSREIYGTFGRYAVSQLRRLEKATRLAEHRGTVLAWLREDRTPSLDEVAARLANAATKDEPSHRDAELLAKEYVKQLYRSLFDQGLIPARDFASLVVLARSSTPGFELPRDLRPKNAYNLLRLIATAVKWLREGKPQFEVDGPLRSRLAAIKKGEVPLADVLAEAETMTGELELARQATCLPAHPDVGRADRLLRRIGEEVASHWLAKKPGPFGRDAPAPPEVVWKDAE